MTRRRHPLEAQLIAGSRLQLGHHRGPGEAGRGLQRRKHRASVPGCVIAMRRTTALLLCAACNAPRVPVVHLDQTDGDATFERVDDACAFWGVECYPATDEDGALTILLGNRCAHDQRHGDEPLCGEVFDKDPCSPMLFAVYWDMALEHEIGHVFGLAHDDDEGNVMFWFGAQGEEATEKQERRVQRGARALATCPGPW